MSIVSVEGILDQYTKSLLAVLGLDEADDLSYRRVNRFVSCNGYAGVRKAAEYTAKQALTVSIADPWAYTIKVYNGNLARLSCVYTLVHLVETGLRSQVDLRLTAAMGKDWFLYAENYLAATQVRLFQGARGEEEGVDTKPQGSGEQPGVLWAKDEHAPGRLKVVDPCTSAEFLERITFGWLATIVRQNFHSHLREAFVEPKSKKTVSFDEVKALLDYAKDRRRVVAHNRYMDDNDHARAHKKLARLLALLGFDVVKAQERIENERSLLMNRIIERLPAS